ncbi:hypothetical protein [Frondihabitans sucicola]|nr:hypothetical protein [Frondihabitans sucicola]
MTAQLRLVERPDGVRGPIASESDVHFFCIGRDRWTIYDRRVDPAAPGAFLGRLRRVAGLFEVSFADPDRPRAYCASLNDSRSQFVGHQAPARRPALRLV